MIILMCVKSSIYDVTNPEVLVKRIKGRALREHRFDDDDEHVIRRRLKEYEAPKPHRRYPTTH